MISATYDDEADALYVRIAAKDTKVFDTREVEPGVMLDLDAGGRVIAIEVLNVKTRTAAPAQVV